MKIVLIYNSKSGFTKKYAKIISSKLSCKLISINDIKNITEYDTIIFGSRIIAGKIEKLKKIRNIVKKNNINKIIIFTTGSTPNEAKEILEKMWQKNLTKEELISIPHFHMQSGMNLEKLPSLEKAMLNMAKKIMKNKKNKTSEDLEFEKAISNSFDISDEQHTKELIKYMKNLTKNKEE